MFYILQNVINEVQSKSFHVYLDLSLLTYLQKRQ